MLVTDNSPGKVIIIIITQFVYTAPESKALLSGALHACINIQ